MTTPTGSPPLGDVANSFGMQAVVSAIARSSDADFDAIRTLSSLAEVTQASIGARGVAIEESKDGTPGDEVASVGERVGSPRRLPVIAEGREIGFLAIYGAPMFGPATADRTQILADLTAIALTRKYRLDASGPLTLEEGRYRLISGVGHNLRNTLGAATGYMQLVEMEGELTYSQQEYINRSRRAVTGAVSLINDLIEVTRADAGKLSFDREPLNVNAVARETVRKHKDSALVKNCYIDVVAAASNPIVITDSTHIRQIIDVLVYNAVRYATEGGEVVVTVEAREGRRQSDPAKWICVSVRNSGTGVVEGDNVFEAVHRVEQHRGNARFRLAICRRVARLLGGDLTLESIKDVGATFTLWVPAPPGA